MSDQAADSFANSDTPIPVVSVTGPDDHSRPSLASTPGSDSRHRLSASKLKDKLQSLGDGLDRSESPNRFSDKMFTMYLRPSRQFEPVITSRSGHLDIT